MATKLYEAGNRTGGTRLKREWVYHAISSQEFKGSRMPLICLFGPGGSGKTTLAKVLARELEDHGFNVRVSWMRAPIH